jgi:hypothetical protein
MISPDPFLDHVRTSRPCAIGKIGYIDNEYDYAKIYGNLLIRRSVAASFLLQEFSFSF